MSRTRPLSLLALLGVCLLALAAFWLAKGRPEKPRERQDLGTERSPPPPAAPSNPAAPVASTPETTVPQAGNDPPVQEAPASPARGTDAPLASGSPGPDGHAQTSPPASTNPQRESVVEAARTGKHPDRLTSLIKSRPFDPQKKDEYLKTIGLGRIFQPAKPGPGIKALQVKGSSCAEVRPGESVRLTVLAEPKSCVSFLVSDKGVLQNGLPACTLEADKNGEASVTYTPTSGTTQTVNIMAAGTGNSEIVRFVVEVIE